MGASMKDRPVISTAIPKRRFQIGDYGVTLLGEIASSDRTGYRYILAFVRMGQREPELYVCSQEAPPGERSQGAYRLRLVSEAMSEDLDVGDQWGNLDTFSDQGLALGIQALGLQSEMVARLM